jgi:hypothetical protein
MEGGDQTDDIGINDPDERVREQRRYKRRKDDNPDLDEQKK